MHVRSLVINPEVVPIHDPESFGGRYEVVEQSKPLRVLSRQSAVPQFLLRRRIAFFG